MCKTPSKCMHGDWIFTISPTYKGKELTEIHERILEKRKKQKQNRLRSGKWLVYVYRKDVDEVWDKIKSAREKGILGIEAKVATKEHADFYGGNTHVICVYTYDWTDEKDVRRVREGLRKLGITKKIPYKADVDTIEGKYRDSGYTKISKYYE